MTAKPTFWQWFWRHGVYLFAAMQWGWVTMAAIATDSRNLTIVGVVAIEAVVLHYVFVQTRREVGS